METALAKKPLSRCSLAESQLDRFLGGGLPWGTLSEWGLPWGQGGRELILRGLGEASRREAAARLLWISPDKHLTVYGPAWSSLGVPIERWRFVASPRPMAELKPALLDPLFRFLVFDAPRSLSSEDMAFLALKARQNRQIVLILRDGWLSPERGNVFARLRINCRLDPVKNGYVLTPVRGLPPGDAFVSRRAPDAVPGH
jgi:hypothetical protein